GPLVVAREGVTAESLKGKRVAIPGKRTTAALLLRLFNASVTDLVVMPFDKILQATADGTVDAGLIIHESRFTYQRHGLHQVVDLGEWWEESTGHAIPLGGILARRSLGAARIAAIDRALKASVERAYSNPADIWDTVRAHAQEMDDDVMRRHIDLYVNEFTLDYGDEGEDAIRYLFNAAEELGIIPRSDRTLFIDR
ncbi:MAG: 1,4-dihydroxy-6-naphthoate synthase, partial [Candidatus Poribacteria bacterium]|nr:1,4-dihydroxy-6-naphthoate synthase [Candidatus Poribacteria bacterium]